MVRLWSLRRRQLVAKVAAKDTNAYDGEACRVPPCETRSSNRHPGGTDRGAAHVGQSTLRVAGQSNRCSAGR